MCCLPAKGLCPPEGSCSAVGLGTGERRLPEAPWHGHVSREAGKGESSPHGAAVVTRLPAAENQPSFDSLLPKLNIIHLVS